MRHLKLLLNKTIRKERYLFPKQTTQVVSGDKHKHFNNDKYETESRKLLRFRRSHLSLTNRDIR